MVQHLLWDNAQLRQTLNDYALSYVEQVRPAHKRGSVTAAAAPP